MDSKLENIRRSLAAILVAGTLLGTALADDGPYISELEAVIAAANRYNPISIAEDREYMGAILAGDAGYVFTVTRGAKGRDRITARVTIPEGFTVVAFWHTHGSPGRWRKYFSSVDSRLVARWKKPFYLADPAGRLRVLRPGDPTLSPLRAQQLGLPRARGFAIGARVADESGDPIRVAVRT